VRFKLPGTGRHELHQLTRIFNAEPQSRLSPSVNLQKNLHVRGMCVNGMEIIPLTNIPLTLLFLPSCFPNKNPRAPLCLCASVSLWQNPFSSVSIRG
jgi:hypothetical protein